MNKIRNDHYSTSPAFILLALSIVLGVLMLAGCLGDIPSAPASIGTLPPAPVATQTAEALSPAYPSPGEPYPDTITDASGNGSSAYPAPATPVGAESGASAASQEIAATATSEVYFPVIGVEGGVTATVEPTATATASPRRQRA